MPSYTVFHVAHGPEGRSRRGHVAASLDKLLAVHNQGFVPLLRRILEKEIKPPFKPGILVIVRDEIRQQVGDELVRLYGKENITPGFSIHDASIFDAEEKAYGEYIARNRPVPAKALEEGPTLSQYTLLKIQMPGRFADGDADLIADILDTFLPPGAKHGQQIYAFPPGCETTKRGDPVYVVVQYQHREAIISHIERLFGEKGCAKAVNHFYGSTFEAAAETAARRLGNKETTTCPEIPPRNTGAIDMRGRRTRGNGLRRDALARLKVIMAMRGGKALAERMAAAQTAQKGGPEPACLRPENNTPDSTPAPTGPAL